MKKYAVLTLHYCFFITSLLFLPKEISLWAAGFLVSVLSLENICFTLLPLILGFYLPLSHTYILIAVFAYHILLYPFIKRNRFYALGVYALSSLTAFIVLYIIQGFSLTSLIAMLFSLVIYGVINMLYVYQQTNQKINIIPYNQKLIDLTMLLGYVFMIHYYSTNSYVILFLFMQLFLIRDFKYNIVFMCVYAMLVGIPNPSNLPQILMPTAVSYLPISVLFTFTFKNLLWIPGMLYSIVIMILPLTEKKLTIEQNYINTLFEDFNKYIQTLNTEYDKNVKIMEVKEKRFEEISREYCLSCSKNTLCKTRLEDRKSVV